jgi:hypothetical protein
LNALWKIKFDKELATYNKTSIELIHIKSRKYLGLYGYDTYHKSPITEHTEGNKLKVILLNLSLIKMTESTYYFFSMLWRI